MKHKLHLFITVGLLFLLTACPGGGNTVEPSLEGIVFEDANANGSQNSGENGLAGITVFLDEDDDGVLDSGELSQVTDSQGKYRFSKLEPGTYSVRQVLPFGYRNVSGGVAPTIAPTASHAKASQPKLKRGPKIVGGIDANQADFPFMAAIGLEDELGFFQFCGGSLISDSWILTAAHCSVDDEGAADPVASNYKALLGTDTLSSGGQLIDISEVIVHPSYVVKGADGEAGTADDGVVKGFDIALWKLAEPVSLATNLRTIAMLDAATANFAAEDVLATAIGWGTLSFGGSGPDRLQVVHAPVFNADQCLAANLNVFDIDNFDTQICAGVLEGGIDSCQGDSGGPLIVRNGANDQWLQAGITSYGLGCAFPGFPGIYARVSALSDWVKETTAELSNIITVTITSGSKLTGINFGDQIGLRPFIGNIEPRWQTTNLTPDPAEPNPGDMVTFSWRILDEGTSTFSCSLDFDGAEAGAAVDVPCSEGETSLESPAGYTEGVYLPILEVTKAATVQTREIPLVAGNPISDTETGALTITDEVDVDFLPDTYFIDYYDLDLTGIPAGRAILIQLESTAFEPFIGLYDGDVRDPTDGGGFITSGDSQLIFAVEAGVNYVIGVSSFNTEETGAYSLNTSSGSLIP